MSDVFDQTKEHLAKDEYAHLDKEILKEVLEDKDTFGDTFFVPQRARWNEGFEDENGETQPPIKHLQNNIGQMLNKALDAIEEANAETLSGVFKGRINFNKEVDGKQIVKNKDLKDMIDHFNEFPALINENFEVPDLLGAAYEYLLKHFADESGKKGGQFYTPSTVVRLLVQLLQPKEGMSIYDPTAGSGGMLIQSHNYITEQGQNANNLELFGQELDPTVVAICKMNIILHNINKYTVEYGDTLAEPLNEKNGQLIQFDRVIANPPFSQNYNRAEMKYTSRFPYGFAPETGKKADLMFVQHMLASCKRDGRVVVVMPHGVLFRGGKEKEIREGMLKADVIEGIIGLPPQLFYGTGIPACVLVLNKSKADKLKDKVFIINADKEFAEGKKQNNLRPEDVEKIDFVFSDKIEEAKYSELVDVKTIADNDYTLNIRRYVDNTPEPEPEDVKAHLVGGVPVTEIEQLQNSICKKFNYDGNQLFKDKNETYKHFTLSEKTEIKENVDNDNNVEKTLLDLGWHLANWWQLAKEDFSKLAPKSKSIDDNTIAEPIVDYISLGGDKTTPKVRQKLLDTIKDKFVPVGVFPKSLTEQKKIAEILSKVDTAIKQTQSLIAKYQRIKTGLMQDLLTKGIDENGNIRSEETQEFKELNGVIFPKEWEIKKVGNCLLSIEQGWSPNCESEPSSLKEWGVLKTTAVTWKGYNETENKRMPTKLTPKTKYEVKNRDVLITRAGPNSRVGVVSFVETTREKLIISDKLYRLIPRDYLVNKYLALALSGQFTQKHLSTFKTGMAESQTNISQEIVTGLNILLPKKQEQERIIQIINNSEKSIDVCFVELRKFQSLKTALMQDLLSGKKRVSSLIMNGEL